jgi:uncharacterized protein YbcI
LTCQVAAPARDGVKATRQIDERPARVFRFEWDERFEKEAAMEGRGVAVKTGKAGGKQLAAISDGIVKLHSDYYGKGPTQAKTYAIDDTIICILKGGFTKVEETLMEDGKWEEVERLRRAFQRTMRDRFTAVVDEALPEREVIGYMSEILSEPHVAIELFLLSPADEPLIGTHELRAENGPGPSEDGPGV